MVKLLVALISYLPKDVNPRRIESIHKSIEDYKLVFPDAHIIIGAQNWKEEHKEQFKDKAEIIEFEPHSAARARNKCIEYFQNHKEYSWMLLSDDDTGIYPYYSPKTIVDTFDSLPEHIRYINATNGQIGPFKKRILDDLELYQEYYTLSLYPSQHAINPVFIRQDENIHKFDENMKMIDDDMYWLELWRTQTPVYNCPLIITKSNARMYEESVIDYTRKEDAEKYIYNKLGVTWNGKYSYTELYQPRKDQITRKRIEKVLFQGKEIEFTPRSKTNIPKVKSIFQV